MNRQAAANGKFEVPGLFLTDNATHHTNEVKKRLVVRRYLSLVA
jgi:hypothetical protein